MGQTTESTRVFIGDELMMRLNTFEEGEINSNNGRINYSNKTVLTVNNKMQTITATRTGTGYNKNYKKIQVAKSARWNYVEDTYKTWEF